MSGSDMETYRGCDESIRTTGTSRQAMPAQQAVERQARKARAWKTTWSSTPAGKCRCADGPYKPEDKKSGDIAAGGLTEAALASLAATEQAGKMELFARFLRCEVSVEDVLDFCQGPMPAGLALALDAHMCIDDKCPACNKRGTPEHCATQQHAKNRLQIFQEQALLGVLKRVPVPGPAAPPPARSWPSRPWLAWQSTRRPRGAQ